MNKEINNPTEDSKSTYEAVNALYTDVYAFLSQLTDIVKKLKLPDAELCDVGFFCREMENLFDELRKEAKARKELIGRVIAFNRIRLFLSDPSIDQTVRGKYATGTPDVTQAAELPKKGTPEYYALTDYFGVDRKVAESGVVKLDWNAIADLVTLCAGEGKKLPPGLGKTIPVYTTTFRKRGNNGQE